MAEGQGLTPMRGRTITELGRGCPASMRAACFAVTLWLLAIGTARADDPSREFWPEIDTWWRLSPAWRVSLFVPVSRNVETDYREGNFIPQVDFAWGKPNRLHTTRLLDENRATAMKAMMVRSGYLHGNSLDDQGESYSEQTIFAEFHVRTPLKRGILASHRLRTDVRWLGQDPELSNRWRYRLMVEKDFERGRMSVVPYVNVEPYYDSRYETVNRIRWINGATVAWSPRYAIEGKRDLPARHPLVGDEPARLERDRARVLRESPLGATGHVGRRFEVARTGSSCHRSLRRLHRTACHTIAEQQHASRIVPPIEREDEYL